MEEAPVNACPPGFRPWVHFLFLFLFFPFPCLCFLSLHCRKAAACFWGLLKPSGCPGHWFVPTDQCITMIPAFSVMRPTCVIVRAPRIARHHVCDHARCSLSPRLKRKMDSCLSPPADSKSHHLHIWFLFRGKATAATFCHLKRTFFSRPQATKPFQVEPLGTHRHCCLSLFRFPMGATGNFTSKQPRDF